MCSLVGIAAPAGLEAQVEASVFLGGTAFVGDTAMVGGTVVLHHVNEGTQGELDSMAVGPDGSFTFRLPNVPDPGRGDVFFASIRHHGILYFGGAITTAAQLDTVYDIHAYDSMVAPVEGLPVILQSRSVFFEPDSTGWGQGREKYDFAREFARPLPKLFVDLNRSDTTR